MHAHIQMRLHHIQVCLQILNSCIQPSLSDESEDQEEKEGPYIPKQLSRLTSLVDLCLQGFQPCLSNLCSLPNLTSLQLASDGGYEDFPSTIAGLQSLSFLRLSDMNIEGCFADLSVLSSLIQLHMHLCWVRKDKDGRTFAHAFASFHSLQELSINKSSSDIVGALCLSDLTALTYLQLKCNHMQAFDCCSVSTNLRELDVSFNSLSVMPANITMLGNLRYLDVSHQPQPGLPALSPSDLLHMEDLETVEMCQSGLCKWGACFDDTSCSIDNFPQSFS